MLKIVKIKSKDKLGILEHPSTAMIRDMNGEVITKSLATVRVFDESCELIAAPESDIELVEEIDDSECEQKSAWAYKWNVC